jgi:hypothetical protein
MDRKGSAEAGGGIGILGVLAIVFIALKLAEVGAVAKWSWWWVLAPIWMPLALALVILLVVIAVVVIKD